MIFAHLVINNFGVYKGRHEFDLRPQVFEDEHRPVVLFGGKNGTGKTTILEAIRLCLYGRAALGTRIRRADYDAFIRQRFHRSLGEVTQSPFAEVGLVFEHTHAGVKSTYDASRSWRLNGQTVEENISLYKDGKILQDIAVEHWNDFLRDLIPPGLSDLFFFDGEQIQALADDENEAVALSTAIGGLLNLDLVERLQSDLSVYLKQQEQQEHSRLKLAAQLADEAYTQCKLSEEESRQDYAQLVSRMDGIRKRLEAAQQMLLREGAVFVKQRTEIEVRQHQIEKEIERVREDIRVLAGELLPFSISSKWSLILRKRLEAEATQEHRRIIYDAQREKAAQISLKLLDNKIQSAISSKILPQDWVKIASMVQELLQPDSEAELLEIRHQISAQDRELLYQWIEVALKDVPQHLQQLSQKLESLEQEQNRLNRALKQVPSDEVANPMLNEFTQLLELKGRLEEQMAFLREQLKQYEFELNNLERQRHRAWQQLAEAGDIDIRVQRAAKIQVILDEYLAQITQIKIRELEQAIAQYFNTLCRKQILVQEVHIDPKKFTVELFGENRTPIYRSDLSAGEKQLYAMSLLWALRSVSGRALPIIVDTPMGRLDSDHREAMIRRFFPYAAHQIILLSTDTEIGQNLYKVLEPSVSHTFELEFNQEKGCTEVYSTYFDQSLEGIATQ